MDSIFDRTQQEFAPGSPAGGAAVTSSLAPTSQIVYRARTGSSRQAKGAAAPSVTMAGGYSLTGSRVKNEDSLLIDAQHNLWAVSDGIGGAPFGEVISRVSCNYLPRAWELAGAASLDPAGRLVQAISLVDRYVSDLSDLLGGMGSGATLTVAHYDGGRLTIASIGDSRAFLLRDGALSQMSESGRLSSNSNALDQALGYHLDLKPTVLSFVPQQGDALLICSDGVWSTQSPESMSRALSQGLETPQQFAARGNPQRMACRVVEEADMTDNATAVVVLFANNEQMTSFTPTL